MLLYQSLYKRTSTLSNSSLSLKHNASVTSTKMKSRFYILAYSRTHCYDLPSVKMERSTSFGYGKKISFPLTLRKTPPPDAYNIGYNIRRGFTFGLPREYYTNMSFKRKMPGPGDYKEQKVMGSCGKKFSFRNRPSAGCTSFFLFSLAL